MGYSQAHGGREAAPGEQQEQPGPVNSSTGRILRIGCALLPKKVRIPGLSAVDVAVAKEEELQAHSAAHPHQTCSTPHILHRWPAT
jgi:hypothetical protein